MEKLKFIDIVKLTDKEIDLKINNLDTDLFKLKIKKYTSSIEKPHMLKIIKSNIARLKTAKRTKELNK
ncbi:MAG: 50S ribosomal protein L29 [Oligoflexia bacterium]|nr:50S ribosomal protein L29 [Oligoflexia bacterium]